MAGIGAQKLFCAVLALMLVATPPVACIGCGLIQSYISSCFNWLHNIEYYVKKECCNGVVFLDQLVKNNATNSVSACKCVREYYLSFGFDTTRADQIPLKCNITLSYQINPHKC